MHINVKSPTQESHFAQVAKVGGSRFFASTTVNQRRIQEASPYKTAVQKCTTEGKDAPRQYFEGLFSLQE